MSAASSDPGERAVPVHDRDSRLRDRYENHHRVTITDAALVNAATLADRYINDRFLPDKAIDLIDEAGARPRIRRMTAPPDLRASSTRRIAAGPPGEKESAIDAQGLREGRATARRREEPDRRERPSEKEWRPGTSTSSLRLTRPDR